MDVVDIGATQQPLDRGPDLSGIRGALLRMQHAASSVAVGGQGQLFQLFWYRLIFGMATARFLVYVDWARKGEGFELLEGVVRKQDPPVRAGLERPQAKPTGTGRFPSGKREEVDEIDRRLKGDGFDVDPPQHSPGYTFYVDVPGGFTVEVLAWCRRRTPIESSQSRASARRSIWSSSEMVGSRINSSTPRSSKLVASAFNSSGVVGADSATWSAHCPRKP